MTISENVMSTINTLYSDVSPEEKAKLLQVSAKIVMDLNGLRKYELERVAKVVEGTLEYYFSVSTDK